MRWKALLLAALYLGAVDFMRASDPMTFKELSFLVRQRENPKFIIRDTTRRKLLEPLSPEQEATLSHTGATSVLLEALRHPALIATPEMVADYQLRQSQLRNSSQLQERDTPSRGTAWRGMPSPSLERSRLVPDFNFPKEFVGCPHFQTKGGKISAGTAALAKLDESGTIYLLTVRHLLGPAGGYSRDVGAEEIPGFVTGIHLNGLFAGSRDLLVRGFAISPSPDENAPRNDLAIFQVLNGSRSEAAKLASKVPAIGDPVWLIAHVSGGVPKGQQIHPATVVSNRGAWLLTEYENSSIIANGSSGGPVVNSDGEIVGINTASTTRNGKQIAFLIPTSLITSEIRKAGH